MSSLPYPLSSTFQHNGWSIKYIKLEQPKTQPKNRPADSIVFVHGTPWSSDVFRPLAHALRATELYNIILYDLPGYGQSREWTRPDGHIGEPDTSVQAQGLALAALLKHLNLDNGPGPKVIAHDIAGVISLRAHLLYGCDYQSLCLLDTNCVLPWGDKLYNQVRKNPNVFEEMPPGVFEGLLKAVIRSARARAGTGLGEEWEDILARPWLDHKKRGHAGPDSTLRPQVSFVRQIKQADDIHTAELEDEGLYRNVRCPVKILWGEEDQWIPRDKMEKLVNMLGEKLQGFVTIPDAGHLVMLDQPERVAIEISRWLEVGR